MTLQCLWRINITIITIWFFKLSKLHLVEKVKPVSNLTLTANTHICILTVIMKKLFNYTLIQEWAPKMNGVFTCNDLRILLNQQNDVILHRQIKNLEEGGVLRRFKKGFYTVKEFDPKVLACRMYPDAYISLGSILAEKLLIGSVPAKTTYAVKTGRARMFSGSGMTISYFGISPGLLFGYSVDNGVRRATAEKAFLDTLYFHQKGRRFSFDFYTDVDTTRLDIKLIKSWLPKYKNGRFISFVKDVLRV